MTGQIIKPKIEKGYYKFLNELECKVLNQNNSILEVVVLQHKAFNLIQKTNNTPYFRTQKTELIHKYKMHYKKNELKGFIFTINTSI